MSRMEFLMLCSLKGIANVHFVSSWGDGYKNSPIFQAGIAISDERIVGLIEALMEGKKHSHWPSAAMRGAAAANLFHRELVAFLEERLVAHARLVQLVFKR